MCCHSTQFTGTSHDLAGVRIFACGRGPQVLNRSKQLGPSIIVGNAFRRYANAFQELQGIPYAQPVSRGLTSVSDGGRPASSRDSGVILRADPLPTALSTFSFLGSSANGVSAVRSATTSTSCVRICPVPPRGFHRAEHKTFQRFAGRGRAYCSRRFGHKPVRY